MSKITDEMIEAVPGLKAARDNGNITFINFDTDDTSPKKTEGFTDDQIREMSDSALQAQLTQISGDEQRLLVMQQDINQRRTTTLNILKRKAEL